MILIVDDSNAARKATRRTLEYGGFLVEEADCGADALAKLRIGDHQLVITDFNMPYMNGLQLTQKIRSIPQAEMLKIAVLSTVEDGETLAQARTSGVAKWLLKPYKADIFLQSVRDILAKA